MKIWLKISLLVNRYHSSYTGLLTYCKNNTNIRYFHCITASSILFSWQLTRVVLAQRVDTTRAMTQSKKQTLGGIGRCWCWISICMYIFKLYVYIVCGVWWARTGICLPPDFSTTALLTISNIFRMAKSDFVRCSSRNWVNIPARVWIITISKVFGWIQQQIENMRLCKAIGFRVTTTVQQLHSQTYNVFF